jgi:hypothetical protein
VRGEEMVHICDYCQGKGATLINEEGFKFHKECAHRFQKELDSEHGKITSASTPMWFMKRIKY